jgi:hypothetical protein
VLSKRRAVTYKPPLPPKLVLRRKMLLVQHPAGADVPKDGLLNRSVDHVSTEARVIYELHRHGIYW